MSFLDTGSKPQALLCGRTGSGKSTVANMLIRGHLNPPLLFPTSSGVRGKTVSLQKEESEHFVVVDTVGLGEAQHGSVVDEEARNMLYDFFVRIAKESYNYFAYVHKWGKVDTLDADLWSFFKKAFIGAEENFVIIFTHCSPGALEENLEDIKVAFKGCVRYVTVDFPAANEPEAPTSMRSRRNDKVRMASLVRLRESLTKFMLPSRSNLCLRSTLNGRILLMGSDTRARNMVAKLLVDGALNMATSASSSGTEVSSVAPDEPKPAFFEELEGQRLQVVNALLFDKESVGGICTGARTKEEAVEVATIAVTTLASEFLAILQHGFYSHFIYVEEHGNRPVEWEPVLQEITRVLGMRQWKKISVAVIVHSNDDGIPFEVPNRFDDWSKVCEVQLPGVCNNQETESENRAVRQRDLGIIEGALTAAVPFGVWGSICYNEQLWVNPNALQALVCTSHGLQEIATLDLGLQYIHSDTGAVNSTSQAIFRSHVKQIAAEISCAWRDLEEGLYISIAGSHKLFRQGLSDGFVWGELQVVDTHHVDRKFRRLPLSIGDRRVNRKVTRSNGESASYLMRSTVNDGTYGTSWYEDFWYIGIVSHDMEAREFLTKMSKDDTVVLWMNPHPHPIVLHEDKFVIELIWDLYQ